MAEMDLTPKSAAAAFEGDGGGYYVWSFPPLGEANVGAGKLVLKPSGFALPHYADSAKLGYVLQGTQSLLGGFSTDFISKSFSITKDEADEVTKNQTGVLLVKVEKGKTMPKPNAHLTHKLVHQLNVSATVTEKEFPFLNQAGLSANLIKLEPSAISSPIYTTDSTVQLIYVVGGGGRIQITGLNGQRVLDAEVAAGQLIVVPRFFMVAKLAGEKGMECFSVITSSRATLEDFTGKTSVLRALSPEVLQISLNINPELQTLLQSKSD